MPTTSPITLLLCSAWMLLTSEPLEPEPITGNWERAECSIRWVSDELDPATMPSTVTRTKSRGNRDRKP